MAQHFATAHPKLFRRNINRRKQTLADA